MHTEKKIRYYVTIKISLCILSPVIHGRFESWKKKAEPLDVVETWLPGNPLVTKEAEGLGEDSCQKGISWLLLHRRPMIPSRTYGIQHSRWKGEKPVHFSFAYTTHHEQSGGFFKKVINLTGQLFWH